MADSAAGKESCDVITGRRQIHYPADNNRVDILMHYCDTKQAVKQASVHVCAWLVHFCETKEAVSRLLCTSAPGWSTYVKLNRLSSGFCARLHLAGALM
ncbi:hypothetical protein NDU88_004288 [Pleurodeles waltl]|uniref:Uncharacterized protein n=1 Tax=Pleurodeles waltl TaxID=8319 RepID=A0AAV7V0U1_PLEWA|nr:hypothetical protein NDU88_004288 [Pleurodeles waltl]